MNSTVRKTIIFFSIIFVPFIVVITCPFIGYMVYLIFDGMFRDSGPSIEKNGLEGCDTVSLAGDKEQLAETFMANVDAIWSELHKNNVDKDSAENYVYDPVWDYTLLCYYNMPKDGKYDDYEDSLLHIYPSKFYKSYTDLILYNKDKLLCLAFIVLRVDLIDFGWKRPPYFYTYLAIGKRDKINEPFRLYHRLKFIRYNENHSKKTIREFENEVLYNGYGECLYSDVFHSDKERRALDPTPPPLPLPTDSNFFEKHPLFEKFDDSTYNFEWYKDKNQPGGFSKYNYPY